MTPLPTSPAPLWRPPGPSLASRQIAIHERSTASCRPSIVGGSPPREIRCESGLERRAALVLLTHPQVADLQEQPEAFIYEDAAGHRRRHTFDFLVTLEDGRKLAVSVKPKTKAERNRLRELCELMASQMPQSFADGILIVTDADLPRDVVHNAALLHQSLRGADPAHDAALARLLTERGCATIGDLVAAVGLAGDGLRAVVRAIAKGTIRLVEHSRIGYATRIEWAGSIVGEAP